MRARRGRGGGRVEQESAAQSRLRRLNELEMAVQATEDHPHVRRALILAERLRLAAEIVGDEASPADQRNEMLRAIDAAWAGFNRTERDPEITAAIVDTVALAAQVSDFHQESGAAEDVALDRAVLWLQETLIGTYYPDLRDPLWRERPLIREAIRAWPDRTPGRRRRGARQLSKWKLLSDLVVALGLPRVADASLRRSYQRRAESVTSRTAD